MIYVKNPAVLMNRSFLYFFIFIFFYYIYFLFCLLAHLAVGCSLLALFFFFLFFFYRDFTRGQAPPVQGSETYLLDQEDTLRVARAHLVDILPPTGFGDSNCTS